MSEDGYFSSYYTHALLSRDAFILMKLSKRLEKHKVYEPNGNQAGSRRNTKVLVLGSIIWKQQNCLGLSTQPAVFIHVNRPSQSQISCVYA